VGRVCHEYPSPADIEEMKACGYGRPTIEQALQLSKRWHEGEAIRNSIRKTFSGVKLGNVVGLVQAQGLDGHEDEKDDWSRISVECLNKCNS
jgi:hypothetical protein